MIPIKRFTITASMIKTIRGMVCDQKPQMVDLGIVKRPRFAEKIKEPTAQFLNRTRHRTNTNPTLNK